MDLRELQAKMDKQKNVLIKYDEKGNPYVSMPVGSIPLKHFEQFQAVCDEEYNGNRWLFIWTMFLRMQHFDLQSEAEYLRQELEKPRIERDEIENQNPLGLLNPDGEN